MPRAVFGDYGLALTLGQVGVLLTHSGLINHTIRYWQREQDHAGAYLRFLLRQTLRLTLPLSAALLPVSVFLALARGDSSWLAVFPLLVLANLAFAVFQVASMALNAGERHWSLLALSVVTNAGRAVLPVALALLLGATLLSLNLGLALHGAAFTLVALPLFGPRLAPAPRDPEKEARWRQELRDFGRPFVLIGAGGWLLQSADRWIVAFRFGAEQAGLFNLATNLAAVVPALAVGALMQLVFPGVLRGADAARSPGDWRALARRCDLFTALVLAGGLGGLLALHAAGPWLLGWLIAPRYADSLPLLLPAGCASMAAQANQFQYLLLAGRENSRAMVKVMLVVASARTLGCLLAAAWSLPAFLAWVVASTPLVAVLGRVLVRRAALPGGERLARP